MAGKKHASAENHIKDRHYSSLEENIVPSQVPEYAWLQCSPEESFHEKDQDYTGKWMIFTKSQVETDILWPQLKSALYAKELGISMKSATKPSTNGVLTCVYTKDWRNIPDIRRVLQALRKLGIHARIYYKSDAQTLLVQTIINPLRD